MNNSQPATPMLSGIRDNLGRGSVGDFLREKLQPGSAVSIVSAYFTIYAYDALQAELDAVGGLRFLFGEPRFVRSIDPDKTRAQAYRIEDNGMKLANRLEQSRVARACAEWIRAKVEIRSIRKANLLHGKMYHIATGGVQDTILGSSNFTVSGLGGDVNAKLKQIQHEIYFALQPHLVTAARDRYLNAARLLEVETEVSKRLTLLARYDHRSLQAAHDMIAAHFCYTHFQGGQIPLPFDSTPFEQQVQGAWEAYFVDEVRRLVQDDSICRSIVKAVVYDNTPQGSTAENVLYERLLDCYPELASSHKHTD